MSAPTLEEQIEACEEYARMVDEQMPTAKRGRFLQAAAATLRELQEGKWQRVGKLKEHNFHGFD